MKKIRMPPGFQFNPSDQQLIAYLKMKAKGVSFLPWENVVLEKNLYSEKSLPWIIFNDDDPWQITTKVDAVAGKINVERVVYVVTKLVKIGDKKTVRRVGSWTWSGATGQSNIFNHKGEVIGFKKMLNLKGKGMEIVGNWIMHEYHLSGVSLQGIEENDYVICRIKWDNFRRIKSSSRVQESDGLKKLGKRRASFDQEIPVGKKVCSRGSNTNDGINEGDLIAESEAHRGRSDEFGSLSLESSKFGQENPIGTGVCSRGRDSNAINEGDLIAERSLFLETEAYCEGTDKCQTFSHEKSRFEQESGKRVCTRGSNSILLINEGNTMEESSLISATEVPENSFAFECLSTEKSGFDQESSIGTGVSCSRINNTGRFG